MFQEPLKKIDEIMFLVKEALEAAETDHPDFVDNAIEGAALIMEEAGECLQEVLNLKEGKPGASVESIRLEAAQTAAVAIRFVLNVENLLSTEKRKEMGLQGLLRVCSQLDPELYPGTAELVKQFDK